MWRGVVTVITENTIYKHKKAIAEEGIAVLIQSESSPEESILFDCGRRTPTILHNLEAFNVALSGIRTVILSHGHAGHIGAIAGLLPHLNHPRLIVHPSIFKCKAKSENGTLRPVNTMLRAADLSECCDLVLVRQTTQVHPNVWISGEVPIVNSDCLGESDRQRYWVMKTDEYELDDFEEELSMFIDTSRGILVITGCGHRGIPNIIKAAQTALPHRPVLGVLGGFHLMEREETTPMVIDSLRQADVRHVLPCHCTGFSGRRDLSLAFPEAFGLVATGTQVHIDEDTVRVVF